MSDKPHLLFTNKKRGWGGEPLMVQELAERFRRRGYRITVAANPESQLLARLDPDLGIEVLRLTFTKGFPRMWRTLMRESRQLARYVRDENVGLVHSAASFDTWVAAVGLRTARLRTPLVRTKHNLKPIGITPQNRWYYGRGVTHFIAPSKAVYEHLLASSLVGPNRVRYIPNGISLEGLALFEGTREEARTALEIGPETEIVAYVSRLSPRKDPQTLARAVQRLAATRPNLQLLVAGEGDSRVRKDLQHLAASGAPIRMLGFRKDVGRVLAASDVFCLPSLTEPFGLAPLEAMLSRVPCVLSDANGFEDYLRDGENGLRFPAGDDAALAAALERALSDADLRARLIEEGERTVRERFHVARMVDETEQLYLELLDGS